MSYRFDRPVMELLIPRIKITFYYGIWAILFAIAVSIPLGLLASYKQNSIIDNFAVLFSQIGVSIPNFWLGMMLIAFVSVRLGWIDPVPEIPPSELWSFPGFFTSVKPYLLAIITLGTGMMATMTRMTRSSMLEVIREDYITLARSKGLSERVIVLKHAFRNALIPVATILGFSFLLLVGGAALTERVFGINGLGAIYVSSIQFRDYPVITSTTLLYGFGVVLINLIVDIVYGWIDPRVSLR
jgi:peptide/nickel transport system permease protein